MSKQIKLNQIREGLLEAIKDQIFTDLDGDEGRNFWIEFDYEDVLVTIEGSWSNHCTYYRPATYTQPEEDAGYWRIFVSEISIYHHDDEDCVNNLADNIDYSELEYDEEW